MIVAYEAREELDKTEGRGGTRLLGTFLKRADAEVMAERHGIMDGPGPIVQIHVVRDADGQYYKLAETAPVLVSSSLQEALVQSGLAKLTPAERSALGLSAAVK